MRMWMISPHLLCRKHLIAEHGEIHKAVGNLKHTGRWAKALIRKGYLEPQSFKARHAELVAEMKKRGYKHKSPLPEGGTFLKGKVDRAKSIADLKARCKECFKEEGKQ